MGLPVCITSMLGMNRVFYLKEKPNFTHNCPFYCTFSELVVRTDPFIAQNIIKLLGKGLKQTEKADNQTKVST